jgi:hypothetical protein
MNFDFEEVFDNAVTEGFGPSDDLTPGKYKGAIVSANAGENNDNYPRLGFLFKAAEGSLNADGEDVSGDTIWLNLTFSPKAKDFAARDAGKLGITGAMLNADADAAVQTAVGQEWSFEVKLSKDGKWTNLYLGKRRDGEGATEAPKPKAKPAPTPPPANDAPAEEDPMVRPDDADEPGAGASEGADPWDI